MSKIVAIVQARMGSSRLPCKSLLSLRGKPIIDWILERLGTSKRLNGVLVAVPDTDLDKVLQEHLDARNIPWLAGSENDVLDRFVQAIKATGATHVVRVCADNPLISGEAVDRLVEFYENRSFDYAYNHIPKGNLWPDGLGAELVSSELMLHINETARERSQREHCLNYLWDNAKQFTFGTFDPEEKWLQRPDIKLDIDTANDYARISRLPITPGDSLRQIITAYDETMNKIQPVSTGRLN